MNCQMVCHNLHTFIKERNFSPLELTRWRDRLFDIYHQMRVNKPYNVVCDDLELIVIPNVYAPRFFTDSVWFAQEVEKIVRQDSLLEIGTGTGIVAIRCARNGAYVVATDINPDAVTNANINARYHQLSIDVRWGDVYNPIAANEKFDYIFWAHPFNNWPTPVSDMLMRSGMDYQYEGLKSYIVRAREHLTKNGRLLLGSGDSADIRTITTVANKNGYLVKSVREVEMPLAEWGKERIRYLLLEFCVS